MSFKLTNKSNLKFRSIVELIFKTASYVACGICLMVIFFLIGFVSKNAFYATKQTVINLKVPNSLNLSKYQLIDAVIKINFQDSHFSKLKYKPQDIVSYSIKKQADKFFEIHNGNQYTIMQVPVKGEFDYYYKRGQIDLKDIQPYLPILSVKFNKVFFTNPDSLMPEEAGLAGSLVGTGIIVVISILICFIVSVLTAFYLEEFAPKGKLSNLLNINITNLTAIPSVIYGILGITIFINLFGLPRSSIIVGTLTLSILALPMFIVTTRIAIRNVSKEVREASISLGATKVQTTFTTLFRSAFPNIITGVILSLSRIIGETAPLLIIGMVSFIGSIPNSITSVSTTLPVQIYLWSSMSQISFSEKASLTILTILFIIATLNIFAAYIRKYLTY